MFKINKNAKKKVWSNWKWWRGVKFAKICLENEQHEFQKKIIKTRRVTLRPSLSKMQKLRQQQNKTREAKRLQRKDESPEIKKERIEWAQDKRSRVSEATNHEILNNLDFEEVDTDSQLSESDEN